MQHRGRSVQARLIRREITKFLSRLVLGLALLTWVTTVVVQRTTRIPPWVVIDYKIGRIRVP